MDFILRYRGSLPADPRHAAREKQRIRAHFSPQLRELCFREVGFGVALAEDLPLATVSGRTAVPERMPDGHVKSLFYRVPMGDAEFVPLVNRIHMLYATVDIIWLRQQRPGDIVHDGGDLDNRLKILLDAFRMPLSQAELPAVEGDPPVTGRWYCLLEDDSLISRLSVTTHQLLEPMEKGKEAEVELLIHVNVHSSLPMIGNVVSGFMT